MKDVSDAVTTVSAITAHDVQAEAEMTQAETEFYNVLMFCYDLLARTELAQSIKAPVDEFMIDPYAESDKDLKPGDLVPVYGITNDHLADMVITFITKTGNVDLRSLMRNKISSLKKVEEITGFPAGNLSNYLSGKREMNTGTWVRIMTEVVCRAK